MSPRASNGRRAPAALIVGAAAAAACASLPVVFLVIRMIDNGSAEIGEVLGRPGFLKVMVRSVALAAAVAGTCAVLGVATATVLVSRRWPGGGLWLVVAVLPLAMPSYVAGLGWLAVRPDWSGPIPSWIVLSAVCVPYVTLPVLAALRSSDPDTVDVARSLGSGPITAWRRVTLPQIAPAATAGTLLVALYVLADFGAVAIFRERVLTVVISREFQSLIGRDSAFALAAALVVIAMVLVVLERAARDRGARWRVGSGTHRPVTPAAGRWFESPLLIVVLAAPTVAVLVPTAALVRRLQDAQTLGFDGGELLGALSTTASVAAAAAVVALLLSLPIAALTARYRGPVVTTIETAGYAGHVLPGLVVALALVFFTLRAAPALYQSATILVFAYVVLMLPKAIGTGRTAIEQAPPSLGESARSLGRGRAAAAMVTGRLAAPGLAAGTLLVMLTAMKELPATLVLRPSELNTLATEIWSRTSTGAYGAAAPFALALVLVASVPAIALTRVGSNGARDV